MGSTPTSRNVAEKPGMAFRAKPSVPLSFVGLLLLRTTSMFLRSPIAYSLLRRQRTRMLRIPTQFAQVESPLFGLRRSIPSPKIRYEHDRISPLQRLRHRDKSP